MMYRAFFLLLVIFTSCNTSEENAEKIITELNFPYKKGYQMEYFTKSTFFNPDGSVRLNDSAFLSLKINDEYLEKGGKIHEWLMIPGSKVKSIPDTMYTLIDKSGLINWFDPDLFPGGDRKSDVIILPLKKDTAWKSYFFTYPAKATCISTDTTITSDSVSYNTFLIKYEFTPDYMNYFIKDQTKEEVRGVLYDFYSPSEGKVLTKTDFYVTEKSSGKHLYKILSNKTRLKKQS
ncbi:MAG: hypothetical protein K2X86_17230 [Cytophagaceae bacterium]|nr:hypothetical protein [Cytophagaceae bacterium]